jgi:hypothetical protein
MPTSTENVCSLGLFGSPVFGSSGPVLTHLGVRQEAGKEYEVKFPHGEGLANHLDPE